MEAVKPLLGEGTLTLSDEIIEVGGRVYVRATATLSCNGESVIVSAMAREAESKKGMDEAQITGAASSYARKYALNGLFAIDDTKDADATNQHGKGEAKSTPAKAPVKSSAKAITGTQMDNIKTLSGKLEQTAETLASGVAWVSSKRTEKLEDLHLDEAAKLIAALTKRINDNTVKA